jgi:DNA polymerase-3 subunit epsilon
MSITSMVTLVCVLLGVVAVSIVGGAVWMAVRAVADGAETARTVTLVFGNAALLLIAVVAGAWGVFYLWLLRPLTILTRFAVTLARRDFAGAVAPAPSPLLEPLPGSVQTLGDALRATHHEAQAAVTAATARVEDIKGHLEAILFDLSEGILVCNLNHEILLYNREAARLLGPPEVLGLGRSLFRLLAAEPLQYTLEQLTSRLAAGHRHPDALSRQFVCATVDANALLHGRMRLIRGAQGEPSGYVLTLTDQGRAVAASHSLLSQEWPMSDVYSVDLLNHLRRRLDERAGISATIVGLPVWLHVDSQALIQTLERLLLRLHENTAVEAFDLETAMVDERASLHIVWQGAPLPTEQLDAWLATRLAGPESGRTVHDILVRHHSGLCSQPQRPGYASIRLSLPVPLHPRLTAEPRDRPRPEFYDFDLMHQPRASGALRDQRLRDLTYVVFDTETTGLQPSQGDEIVAIGGVRIVNCRILTTETFYRLVHPGRPIPQRSVRFHGITDDMVRDQPPARIVLPQFKNFVDTAVLVAHNAAFDMQFLTLKESECGVVFDNPVLDTLLLSAYLHDHLPAHDLDTLAARFGVEVTGRHTALGDALVTAGVFLHLLALLEQRRIHTLGQALAATNMVLAIRKARSHF